MSAWSSPRRRAAFWGTIGAVPSLAVVAVVVVVVVLFVAAAQAAPSPSLGFSAGAAPVSVKPANGGSLSARGCAACHAEVYADWSTTRHRLAWDNAVFQDGFAREPLPRCIHCHAPLAAQRAAVGSLPRRKPPGITVAPAADLHAPPPIEAGLLHEGISCAVCHIRDGAILVAKAVQPKDQTPMHDVRVTPSLRDPVFCANCHQFGFSGSSLQMQTTYDEWQRYQAGGGEGTCQSCHMPGGRHLFRGAWDVPLLRRSLGWRFTPSTHTLSLWSKEVGHHYPTGDLFRHLTVEADVDGGWQEIARLGRTYGDPVVAADDRRASNLDPAVDTITADLHARTLTSDTSLRPGETQGIAVPVNARRVRVRYHYAEERHEAAGVAEPALLLTVDTGSPSPSP